MARDFDGANDNIKWGAILQNQSVLAISCWVDLDDIDSDHCVIATFQNGSTGFMLFFDDVGNSANNTWSLIIADSGDTGVVRVEGVDGSASTGLTHLYVEFTANTSNGLRLIIDGVEDANSPANSTGGNGDNSGGSGNEVTVGEDSGGGRDMNGRISELGIWNVIRTDGEIAALAKRVSPLSMPNGLVFYAPLIGKYSPEIDLMGLARGVVTGATTFVHPPIIYPNKIIIPKPQIVTIPSGDNKQFGKNIIQTGFRYSDKVISY